MVPCEACRELEQDTFIPRVLVSLFNQLNHVETGHKFVRNQKSKSCLLTCRPRENRVFHRRIFLTKFTCRQSRSNARGGYGQQYIDKHSSKRTESKHLFLLRKRDSHHGGLRSMILVRRAFLLLTAMSYLGEFEYRKLLLSTPEYRIRNCCCCCCCCYTVVLKKQETGDAERVGCLCPPGDVRMQ
jgi:hypothetical protein